MFGTDAASDDEVAAEELARGVGFMAIKHLLTLRGNHHIVPLFHIIVEPETALRIFIHARDVG